MLPVIAAAQAQRVAREGIVETPMVWIAARNRETNAVEGIGLWRGEDAQVITVQDQFTGIAVSRTFYSSALDIGAIRYEAGLNIRPVTLSLSAIDNAVLVAVREYEARGAEVQIWNYCRHPLTRAVLGIEPVFKGYVNTAPSTRPAPGGESVMEVEVVSTTRMLTIPSSGKKSNAVQLARAPGDKFRQYKGTTAQWPVPWGTEDLRT